MRRAERGRIPFAAAVLAALAGLMAIDGPLASREPGAEQSQPPDRLAAITLDPADRHQTMDGFGATHLALLHPIDALSGDLRREALDAAYRRVGLTIGNLDSPIVEGRRAGHDLERRNDNDRPDEIDPAGFDITGEIDARQGLLDWPEAAGFDGFFLAPRVNVRWASPWLEHLRHDSYRTYLDEAAELVVAAQQMWRDAGNKTPAFVMPFNEPLSGNHELGEHVDRGEREIVDLVKRIGARLRAAGFADIKLVVPNEESEEQSLATAQAIMGDREARAYVGVIGYHTYPYGSTYSSIPNILHTSGQGRPDRDRIDVRRDLAKLGRRYGVPVWMTEVSHGGVDPLSMDALRGRAIHIHDELEYAEASGYFGMNNLWDDQSQREHFGSSDALLSDEGGVVLVDTQTRRVIITGLGYAIGHYARWITRGAVRVGATSGDRLVQVSAFKDDAQERITVVLINNRPEAVRARVNLKNLSIGAGVTGEQSTSGHYWAELAGNVEGPSTFSVDLPAESVTTLIARTGQP